MPFNFSWEDVSSENWLRAFSFPILPWTKPFIPLLELPENLLKNIAVWESIYTHVFSEYQIQIQSKDWVSIEYEGRDDLLQKTVMDMLHQLVDHLGLEVATELEQWVWFHCFCPEASKAMNEWGSVLRYLHIPPEYHRKILKKVEPPVSLIPLLPQIDELVNFERRQKIDQAIKQVAPPPDYEQSPCTKLDHCYESILLYRCIDQALTVQALQMIAKNLNELERLEVVRWAELQIQRMHPRYGHPEYLLGDKYLRPKLFCSEAPSLLGA